MRCDSQAFLLARTFASPDLGREPKARVTTMLQQSKQKLKFKILDPFLTLKPKIQLQFTLLDAKLGAFHFQSLEIHFQSLNGPLHTK